MDGFNVIPVDSNSAQPKPLGVSNSAPVVDPLDANIEIVDENSEAAKKAAAGSSLYLVLSIFVMLGTFGYFGFLVFSRITMLDSITSYSDQLRDLGKTIDLQEMQDFRNMDATLKAINGRLSKHVLNSIISQAVNVSIRNNLQITEYRVDTKEKEVEVNVSAIAPSFKELAEQTEKLFELKSNSIIKSFSVSNLSFESDTKRVKFSMRVIFDKSKVTALALSKPTNSAEATGQGAASNGTASSTAPATIPQE